MAHWLRPSSTRHFKAVSTRTEKPVKVFKISMRSCSVVPENARRRWRKDFRVSELSEESIKRVAETGKGYLHIHLDVHDRPVLIVDASKHFPGVRFCSVKDVKEEYFTTDTVPANFRG